MNINYKSLANSMALPLRRNLYHHSIGRQVLMPPIVTRLFMSDDIYIDSYKTPNAHIDYSLVITTNKFLVKIFDTSFIILRIVQVRKESKDPVQNIINLAYYMEMNVDSKLLEIEMLKEEALNMFTKRENGKIVYANAKDINDKIQNILIIE